VIPRDPVYMFDLCGELQRSTGRMEPQLDEGARVLIGAARARACGRCV